VGASRARARNDTIYGAANPSFRLDAPALSLCLLPGPMETGETTQDILAPAGSSLVVIAVGKNGPRTLRVSADDGRTWSTARGPGIPPGAGHSLPCALAAAPNKMGSPTRLFATYGGNTLDVSDNGGLDWTRVIDGSSNSVAGFVTDSAGETLWYVSEVVLDGVAALWLPIPVAGPLPPAWNVKRLEEWDANGVYSAVADPFDPHAIYLGGEGRLGYLTTLNGDIKVDIPWARSSTDPSLPYTYVLGLWADPSLANHVIWGGGQQGGGPAQVLESTEAGRNAHEIPMEGLPEGSVTSISYLPGVAKLVILMQRWSDATLAAYVIDR
jgi:hypothetical protein